MDTDVWEKFETLVQPHILPEVDGMGGHKVDWRNVIVGSMMGVVVVGAGGCSSNGLSATDGSAMSAREPGDPDARRFNGTIVSLRQMTSTLLISKDEHVGQDAFPNIISVKYDAQTKFLLDGQPATLDQLRQYMNVSVAGHMREGQLVAEVARFSSVLPKNVKVAGSADANTPREVANDAK